MSDDFDWRDAGDAGGVGTDIVGCFPWLIGAVVIIGIVALIHWLGPGVLDFFADYFEG